MTRINTSKKIILMSLSFGLFFTFFAPIINAQSSGDIRKEIEEQQNKLQQTESSLEDAKNNLELNETLLAQASEGIPQIEAEIKKIEAEIELNKAQLEVIVNKKSLMELLKKEKEKNQKDTIKTSYMEWRIDNQSTEVLVSDEFDSFKSQVYRSLLAGLVGEDISVLNKDLSEIQEDIDKYDETLAKLEKSNSDLEQRKQQLEAEIAIYASSINYNNDVIASLEDNLTQISAQIDFLTTEQLEAIRREQAILQQPGGQVNSAGCDGTTPAQGEFYICGNGRDLPMGHGVGMSQYGAKGAADLGYNATQILQAYYSGAVVSTFNQSAEITVRYCPGNPALDHIQDGCDNGAAAVTERVSFDSYLAGLGEMPTSWPIEARKAQMIAARTYAARYTNNGNPNNPICLTTYCQVSYFKNGSSVEADIVAATKNQVLLYNGQYVEALYSADNNQGNGTADYDTRFQDLYGNATANLPYLKSFNDNQFAQNSRLYWGFYCGNSPCGLWPWKSRSYKYSDLDAMLTFGASNLGGTSGAIAGIKNTVGNVANISFERDGSLRVKKVIIQGTNGTAVMGGWWFKYLWNEWVYSLGTYDYIYSQTFNKI